MDDGDCCGNPFRCLTCGDTLPSVACEPSDRNELSAGGVSEDCLVECC